MKKFLLFLFLVNLIKFIPAGLEYLPLQDDFIQYWGYGERSMSYLAYEVGFFNTRPFAGLMDIFFWGRFWGGLLFASVIITLLHFFSLIILLKAFENTGIKPGGIFCAVYMLLPAGFEAVYWLSASTRIVTGMFFLSLAAYAAGSKKIPSWLFFYTDIIAFGFYEQTAAVCFILCLWIAARQKRRGILAYNIAAAALMCIYYKVMAGTGGLADRTGLHFAPSLTLGALAKSAYASLRLFFIGNPLGTGLFMITGFGAFSLYRNSENTGREKLYIGALLFISAFAVHFATGAGYIPFRCVYPAVTGLALITEYTAESCRSGRAFLGIFTALSVASNAYQAQVFSETGRFNIQVCTDTRIEDGVVVRTERKELDLGLDEWYRNYVIEDITQSGWAMTGAVRAWHRDINLKIGE